MLVDLVHGLADQAKFQHRAIILDEARVRGAAGGRQRGLAPGHLLDRADDEIDERAGLARETTSAFDGSHSMCQRTRSPAAACARCSTSAFSELWRVAIVEADVEARARLAGDQVDGGVADIDRGEFEIRRLEIVASRGRAAPPSARPSA